MWRAERERVISQFENWEGRDEGAAVKSKKDENVEPSCVVY